MKSIYNKLAKYYDKLYIWKDYKAESQKICDYIKKYKTSGGNDMLDVACGTGNHIPYLKKYFKITGIDIDQDMLKIARKKYPEVKFIRDDMRTFRINRRFDVIICLFSSIAHLKTYTNLKKTIKNFATHLKPGGVAIIEPFVQPELYIDKILDADIIDEPGFKLVRMNSSRRKGNVGIYDFHYLIGEKGKIRYFVDTMELGMYESRKVLDILKKEGLKAKFIKKPKEYRGRYIGVKL